MRAGQPASDPGEQSPAAKNRSAVVAPQQPNYVRLFHILRMGVWLLLFGCILLGAFLFTLAVGRSQSAPQQAAVSAHYAAYFIAFYILARCVDSFLESAERVRKQ